MGLLDEMAARDTELAKELDGLTPSQRAWLEEDVALRRQAEQLAGELSADAGDVYHQLKQLLRSPTERLRIGLAHGRRRQRLSD